MLLRSILWIGFICLMIPHEPDIGLGEVPSVAALSDLMPAKAVVWRALGRVDADLKAARQNRQRR